MTQPVRCLRIIPPAFKHQELGAPLSLRALSLPHQKEVSAGTWGCSACPNPAELGVSTGGPGATAGLPPEAVTTKPQLGQSPNPEPTKS